LHKGGYNLLSSDCTPAVAQRSARHLGKIEARQNDLFQPGLVVCKVIFAVKGGTRGLPFSRAFKRKCGDYFLTDKQQFLKTHPYRY
jgi:hypothetical protein